MKKRILVTGGSGLLGVNWAVTMRDKFDICLGLHQREVKIKGVETHFLDMCSVESTSQFMQKIAPEIVIHSAGMTSVELCEKSPDEATKLNVEMAGRVASACADLGISLAHISTDHLFSGEHAMQTEVDPIFPKNVYASTKATAENKVSEEYPEALIIRTNFYGWGTKYRRSFSDFILDSLRAQKEIHLFSDVYYTPIIAEVLANTVHDLLRLKASGIFHVVGDERLTKYEFGCKLAAHFGLNKSLIVPVSIKDRADLVPRPIDMSLSNKKTCQLLSMKLGDTDLHLRRLVQQERLGVKDEFLKN